jgi:hypothetical protein
LDSLTSYQVAEWIAFSSLEGLVEERADFRAGQICSTLANIQRAKKEDQVFEPGDFFASLRPHEVDVENEGVLLDDADAQSKLIMAVVFGRV